MQQILKQKHQIQLQRRLIPLPRRQIEVQARQILLHTNPKNPTTKVPNSTANGMKSTAKVTNSISKTCKNLYTGLTLGNTRYHTFQLQLWLQLFVALVCTFFTLKMFLPQISSIFYFKFTRISTVKQQ